MRVVAADRLVLPVAAGQTDDVDVRMARQDPDQLGADVAGRADDADPEAALAVGSDPSLRPGDEPRRPLRRDRRGRSEPRAHRRSRPLTGGWLGGLAEARPRVALGGRLFQG